MNRILTSFCLALSLMLMVVFAVPSQGFTAQRSTNQTNYNKPVSQVYLRTPIPDILGREGEFYGRLLEGLRSIDRNFNNDSYLFLYTPRDGQGIRARVIFKTARSEKQLKAAARSVAQQMLKVARDMGMEGTPQSLNLSSKVLNSEESAIWMGVVKGQNDISILETNEIK